MAKFKVLTPLEYDGERHEPGDSVEVADAKQAQVLIDSGVLEPVAKGKAKVEAE
jgi:hypothetical protein